MPDIKDWTLYQKTLDFLRLRCRAYRLVFSNPTGNEVLKDLARFCRANKSPQHADLFRLGIHIGRQEVWLRIQNHLHLQPDELYSLLNSPSSIQPKE